MERKISFAVNEFYHLFNRGTDKRNIFLEDKDYLRFLILLFICNGEKAVNIRDQFPKGPSFGEITGVDKGATLVDIGAYCFMPNHFHLLVHEKTENGITKFMKKLLTGYSMYFNRKNGRTGNLFEGVFKAVHIDNDEHLNYLFAYTHLNPVKLIDPTWKTSGINDKEKTKEHLMKYRYSSYGDYTEISRNESIILNKSAFPKYFNDFKEFDNFINVWLTYKGRSFGDLN